MALTRISNERPKRQNRKLYCKGGNRYYMSFSGNVLRVSALLWHIRDVETLKVVQSANIYVDVAEQIMKVKFQVANMGDFKFHKTAYPWISARRLSSVLHEGRHTASWSKDESHVLLVSINERSE